MPPGGKATLTATLTAAGKPLTGKGIAFLAGAAPAGQATTNSKGKAKLTVTLAAPTTYTATYTPAAPDAAAYAPSQSSPLALAPSARLTVSIGSYLRAGRRAVGIPGSRVRVRGKLEPVHAGRAGHGLAVPKEPPGSAQGRRGEAQRQVRGVVEALQAGRAQGARQPGRRLRQRAAVRRAPPRARRLPRHRRCARCSAG